MCYAEDLAENGLAKPGYPNGFEHHYFRPNNIRELTAGTAPLMIFMDSMSDLFGSWVPEEQLTQVLAAMGRAEHITFQSLTKAPGRLMKFAHLFPRNLWVGVSSPPDFMMAANGRVEQFDNLPMRPANPMPHGSKVRFLQKALAELKRVKEVSGCTTWMSWEPVSWDMAPYMSAEMMPDWVIIGAASKGRQYYQPDPAHIEPLLELADAAGTAVFYKGNIKPMFQAHDFGSERLNRWREDFPIGADGPAPAVTYRQERARQYGWTLNQHLIEWEARQTVVEVSPFVPRTQMSFLGL
jgi:protein gp37